MIKKKTDYLLGGKCNGQKKNPLAGVLVFSYCEWVVLKEAIEREPMNPNTWDLIYMTFFSSRHFNVVIAGSNILCVILLKFENAIIFLHFTFWCSYYYIPPNKFNDHFKNFNLIGETICMSTTIQLGEINLTYRKDNNKTCFRQQKRWLFLGFRYNWNYVYSHLNHLSHLTQALVDIQNWLEQFLLFVETIQLIIAKAINHIVTICTYQKQLCNSEGKKQMAFIILPPMQLILLLMLMSSILLRFLVFIICAWFWISNEDKAICNMLMTEQLITSTFSRIYKVKFIFFSIYFPLNFFCSSNFISDINNSAPEEVRV